MYDYGIHKGSFSVLKPIGRAENHLKELLNLNSNEWSQYVNGVLQSVRGFAKKNRCGTIYMRTNYKI